LLACFSGNDLVGETENHSDGYGDTQHFGEDRYAEAGETDWFRYVGSILVDIF
jgi:hypothetical protein